MKNFLKYLILIFNLSLSFNIFSACPLFTQIAGSPFSNGGATRDVAYSPLINNNVFLAAIDVTNNLLNVYSVNKITGSITLVSSIATGTTPSSVAFSQDIGGNLFAAVTNSAVNTVSAYKVDTSSGAVSLANTIATGTVPSSVAYSPLIIGAPNKLFAAVLNSSAHTVTVYSVDTSTGAFSAPATFATGTTTVLNNNISFSPLIGGNLFAQVANSLSNNIAVHSVNTSTGAFSAPTFVSIAPGINALRGAFSENFGGNVFAAVTNRSTSNVSVFSVNSSGVYTPVTGSPFPTGLGGNAPIGLAFSPLTNNGVFAVATNNASNNIAAYSVDTSTGVFTTVTGSPFAAGTNPFGASFSPIVNNGSLFVAVANTGSDNISIYLVVPGAPTITSATPNCNTKFVNVTGSGAQSGANITIFADGVNNIGTGVADASGNFNFDSTTTLADGNHTISVTQTVNTCESAHSNSIVVSIQGCASITILSPVVGQIFAPVCTGPNSKLYGINVQGTTVSVSSLAVSVVSTSSGQIIDEFPTVDTPNNLFNFNISILNPAEEFVSIRLQSVQNPALIAEVPIDLAPGSCQSLLCDAQLDALSRAIANKYGPLF